MVKLFTTGCPQCKVLEAKLEAANIKYKVMDDMNEVIEKGYMSAPILKVADAYYVFKDAVQWVNEHQGVNNEN